MVLRKRYLSNILQHNTLIDCILRFLTNDAYLIVFKEIEFLERQHHWHVLVVRDEIDQTNRQFYSV